MEPKYRAVKLAVDPNETLTEDLVVNLSDAISIEQDLNRALELAERYIVGTINSDTFDTKNEDLAWVIAKSNEAEESRPSNNNSTSTVV